MKFKEYETKMKLQLFAEGDEGDEGNEPKTVTMTQEEFDAKINKIYAKASKKSLDDYKKSDEYKELEALKNQSATDAEKVKEKLANMSKVEQELEKIRQENASLKNRSKVKDLKDADQLDFIMFEVNKMVDDKTDFEDALDKFKKDKPSYFNSEDDPGDKGNKNFRSSGNKQKKQSNKSEADAFLERKYKNSPYRK